MPRVFVVCLVSAVSAFLIAWGIGSLWGIWPEIIFLGVWLPLSFAAGYWAAHDA